MEIKFYITVIIPDEIDNDDFLILQNVLAEDIESVISLNNCIVSDIEVK